MTPGAVTDGDSAEVTNGDSAEDAAWRDLIGRFDAPSYSGDAPVPWPAIEDLGRPAAGQDSGGSLAGATVPESSGPPAVDPDSDASPADTEAGQLQPPGAEARPDGDPASWPDGLGRPGTRTVGGAAGGAISFPERSLPGATDADPLEDEHFVPPSPPPIVLDPMAKAAWAGLFGGPGYLVVATVAGWSVPGWAAFAAVAAFIAGFTILVLRVGDDRDDSDPDDGAVV